MTRRALFAANWKMHLGPDGAREFFGDFLELYQPRDDREVWFFPPAVTLPSVADMLEGSRMSCGAQNVHWEPEGAFTGEISVALASEAGASATLVGHSERRHVFGETIEQTGYKVRAVLEGDLTPVFCVGEKLDERESGGTLDVVVQQLTALDGLSEEQLGATVVAYEPVWAIGTGKTATPEDAAQVHAAIREWMIDRGADPERVRILYGGSVKPNNAHALLSESEIDGVLVGGASLNAASWNAIVTVSLD